MEDNNIKELLQNFEKANNQLDDTLDSIKAFTEGMNRYFEVSKEAEKAIEKVEKIKFDAILEIESRIQNYMEDMRNAVEELKDIADEGEKNTKSNIERIYQRNDKRIDALETAVEEIKENQKEMLLISNSIAEIKELMMQMDKSEAAEEPVQIAEEENASEEAEVIENDNQRFE